MKKVDIAYILMLLFILCGCEADNGQSETRFVMDTVVTLTADCDSETLNGAFELCEGYDKLLSRTDTDSEVYRLNNSEGFVSVSEDTVKIIERSLYFSELSGGKFDITVCPVSELWDFNNQVIPSKDEIAEALKNIDYEDIEIKDSTVNLNGKKIDLGGIAKGYVADEIASFFKEKGVKKGIVNLGGNVAVFGEEYNVGIKRPFGDDVIAVIRLRDKSAVTAGIYERYIKSGDKIYHHIIDPETGYGVENELASVTVIGDSSLECDALSTVCMLLGKEKATEIIENQTDTQAVFIDRSGNITLTAGLYMKKNTIYLK
ncbi:MAG: FAD:protein FMN transferase [Clostridia bacterium]|nr:FAD:protein FMN transferase [Clostridia bacterium]